MEFQETKNHRNRLAKNIFISVLGASAAAYSLYYSYCTGKNFENKRLIDEFNSSYSPIYSEKIPDRPTLYFDKKFVLFDQIECTGSMEPALGCKDVLLTQRPDDTDVGIGDIIIYYVPYGKKCFFPPNKRLIHRVNSILTLSDGTKMYVMKGDANSKPDPCPVASGQIEYKVVGILPKSLIRSGN